METSRLGNRAGAQGSAVEEVAGSSGYCSKQHEVVWANLVILGTDRISLSGPVSKVVLVFKGAALERWLVGS